MTSDTKYGDQIPDDHWDEDDEAVQEEQQAVTDSQIVEVLYRTDPRDLRFRVHVDRAHRIAESNQFDPHGRVDWADMPVPVRERVAEVVDGVNHHSELNPGTRIINPEEGDDDE